MTQSLLHQMTDNVEKIRQQMARAAQEAGRKPEDILLCAVCKTQPSDIVRASASLPVDLFGENRMQELVRHHEDGAFLDKPCHFIGHLQTNKVRRVVGLVSMIESVNSPRLLAAIASEAEKQGLVQDILFEINIGEEDSKIGASKEALWPMLDQATVLPSVRVRGLMAIPPAFDNSPASRCYFAMMRRLLEEAQSRFPQAALDTLSMGMSGSFIAAIQEGATLIRIGTAIYGERQQ
ncbi:MAG: YggS family pyridoxal phosphate-dependent enzyme [Christensenellales bacterium]|jgi:pyridoxal phosphate enzyme (YggS family)